MNCDRIKEYLPFIDDGSMEKDTIAEVREHLKRCPECRKEYDEIQYTLNMLHSVLVKNIPDNSQRILDEIQKKIHSRKREKEMYWRLLPAAAVILITVALAYYTIKPKPSYDPVPQPVVSSEMEDSEFFDYIVEYNLEAYELYELVDEVEVIDEYDLREALFLHEYFSVSVDDIIETLDYEELNDLFVSAYN